MPIRRARAFGARFAYLEREEDGSRVGVFSGLTTVDVGMRCLPNETRTSYPG